MSSVRRTWYRWCLLIILALLRTTPASADMLRLATPNGPREAIVTATAQGPAPTIIVLHGAMTTAEQTARHTGFAEAASAHGFAAVFPQGLRRQWNDGREKGGAMVDVDDVAFVRELVAHLVAKRVARADQIYIAGISNGGMMTFRLLCEAAPLFAGAATIIANMPAPAGLHCTPRKAVPLLMFNATRDPLVPYAGGAVGFSGGRGDVWGAEQTAKFFADIAGCTSTRTVELDSKATAIAVSRIEWGRCAQPAGVALFRLEGAGHQVPGAGTYVPRLLGPNTPGLSAAEITLGAFAGRLGENARIGTSDPAGK